MKKIIIYLMLLIPAFVMAANPVTNYTIKYQKLLEFESDEWGTYIKYEAAQDGNDAEFNCNILYFSLSSKYEIGKTYSLSDFDIAYVLNQFGAKRHNFTELSITFGENHSFILNGYAKDVRDDEDEAVDFNIQATYK